MGIAVFPVPSSGLSVNRFPAAIGNPFNIPAGLTLQQTITSSTSFAAGTFPSQIWVVLIGGGGGGANGGSTSQGSGGGGGGGGACIGWMDVPSSGTLYAVIGSGGTGGSGGANPANGSRGGNTTLGSLIAYGGGGGAASSGVSGSMTQAAVPRGPGAGCGSMYTSYLAASGSISFPPQCAPWTATSLTGFLFWNSNSSSTFTFPNSPLTSEFSNWTGGGAAPFAANRDINGGDGLTGAGCVGSNGTSTRGGNSSRDGGTTFTFTGATTTNQNGAAGAGFLANGSGSTGGSGGGGGAGMFSSNTGGTGGNGCILIYY